jgi:hypothetical protein
VVDATPTSAAIIALVKTGEAQHAQKDLARVQAPQPFDREEALGGRDHAAIPWSASITSRQQSVLEP